VIRPDPARVERVMRDTGMDRLQAYRHEQQRLDIVARFDVARAEAARKRADDWADRVVSAEQVGATK
jgi:hypothetical protein